jgi:hypothetical protein
MNSFALAESIPSGVAYADNFIGSKAYDEWRKAYRRLGGWPSGMQSIHHAHAHPVTSAHALTVECFARKPY